MIEGLMSAAGIAEPLRFTSAFSDGKRLFAVRYASDGQPPTLYTKACTESRGLLVVSEPLDEVRDGWEAVPGQSFVEVCDGRVQTSRFAAAD